MNSSRELHNRAVQMLLIGTMAWGVSFPVMKTAGLVMSKATPETSTWFHAALLMSARFGFAGLVLILLNWRSLTQFTRLEIQHGVGLGLFGGAGILFQMDGLAYTHASTSAFLTQGYVLVIPWIVALRDRHPPRWNVLASSALMLVGAAILTEFDFNTMKLGRGEIETLIGSALFTGQILWLERPVYAANNTQRFSIVMFVTMAAVMLPVALLTMRTPHNLWLAISAPGMPLFITILVLICTLVAYMLMNHWQKHVGANEAGIIYGAEPIFALGFALFLPGFFSAWAGVSYTNESLTRPVIIGGAIILAAIVLVQLNFQKRLPTPSKN
ncbi:MAG TPA: DMT family transporter [Methylomirabilota bacterium]|nr:DMT family transporter [Methylomirabilota bacterium]